MLRMWGDSDISSLDEEEEASNLYLLTNEDKVKFENSSHLTFDELFEAFNDLIHEFKKLRLKNKEYRKSNLSLAEKKSKILNENEDYLKNMKNISKEKENFLKQIEALRKRKILHNLKNL